MTGNVKEIFGGPVAREPCAVTVERLEELLAQAKSGDIRGIVYSCVSADAAFVQHGYAGVTSYNQLAGLAVEQYRVAALIADEL